MKKLTFGRYSYVESAKAPRVKVSSTPTHGEPSRILWLYSEESTIDGHIPGRLVLSCHL